MSRHASGLNILIADDDEEARRNIRTFLEKRRLWKVCGEAATGCEAIEMAEALRPDMLVLDLTLPDIDAAEVVPEIKEVCPAVRILVLATPDSGELAVKALAAGASGIALKSDTPKDLLLTVQNIAKNRFSVSSGAERCMKKYVRKEMREMIQERKDLESVIADFERLEAHSPAHRARLTGGAKPRKLFEMKRRPRPR